MWCLFPQLLWAFDISKVVEPPEAKTTFVGSVVQNGIPMQMKQFSSNLTPGEVIGYYKHNWTDNRRTNSNVPTTIVKEAAEWMIISKTENRHSVVVQVKSRQGGGAEGFISVSNLTKPPKQGLQAKKFPRLGGNCVGGGKHSKGINGKKPDFQEFFISLESFVEPLFSNCSAICCLSFSGRFWLSLYLH